MNKKMIIWGSGVMLLLLFVILGVYGVRLYQEKHAKVEVQLVENLVAEVGSSAKLTDYIVSLNGTMPEEQMIDTKTLGWKELSFSYINDDQFPVNYRFSVEVVDTTKPIVWLGNSYTVSVGSNEDFINKIMCADNYDKQPICKLVGEYDLNTVGSYPVVLEAVDSSGN